MKKYILFFSMATAMALVSCNPTNPEEEFGKKDLTIKASIETSKAAVGAEGITWTAGDAILVSCDGEAYNFTTSQAGATADFTSSEGLTQAMVGINPLTAYFGCTQFGAFTIQQNQTISGGESQTKLPMYAYTATAPEKAVVSMVFIPAASVLEVSISSADITLNKVEFAPVEETAVVGNVAGAGNVNPITGNVTFSGNLKSVSANFPGGVSLKNGYSFRMPIGWFSVTGGMKLVLTYNETSTYEEILWDAETFQSYSGTAEAKAYKFVPISLELVMGARDYYVAPNGKVSSKGIRESDPTTLDYALASADAGSTIHLAAGNYMPSRNIAGDITGDAAHKTFEISRGLTLIGAGKRETVLEADGAFHVVSVTAPAESKVVLKDLTIMGGDNSAAEEDANVESPVNGRSYSDGYGAGLIAIGVELGLENILIDQNNGRNAVGAYINDCKATVKSIEVTNNTSSGNGTGFWASASELTMDDCIIGGNFGEGVATGLYIYSAAETACSAVVRNCKFDSNETSKNNVGVYVRGADASANVSATFTNCAITRNKGNMGSSFGVTYATVLFDNCQISNNISSGNGGSLVYPGAKVTVKDCIFRENKATLGAAIYEYTNGDAVELTILNSEFSANTTNGRGGAIYARAGAASGVSLNVANSTFFSNEAASTGSAIALYGSATFPVKANIYSSTFTGNICTRNKNDVGGAIGLETAGLEANIYNCVLAGNIWEANKAAADVFVKAGNVFVSRSVVNTAVYAGDNTVDTGAPAFNAATMLSKKEAEGKTTVFSLTGSDNPARTLGLDVPGLKELKATIDNSILEKDQWGNARTGAVMGAYVE
ncbi:MAG: hypothetical protein J5764_06755 [Bacteroidales bacterium]|nr:hypothetical protein [Bacteroidales bacterium]